VLARLFATELKQHCCLFAACACRERAKSPDAIEAADQCFIEANGEMIAALEGGGFDRNFSINANFPRMMPAPTLDRQLSLAYIQAETGMNPASIFFSTLQNQLPITTCTC
jgi:hypothetical protein